MSEELKELYNKVVEIQELYYKIYPQGDYLNMCITRDHISINNEHWGVDSGYPIIITRIKGEDYD